MHRASSLRVVGAAAAPVAPQEAPAPARDESAATSRSATATATRSTAAPSAAAPSPAAIVLPPAPPAAADRLAVIAARRSVRRFARTPLPLAALAGVLQAMHAPGRARLSPAVRIDVVVNAVAGLAPGAYHYAPQAHVLRPRRTGVDLRAAARAAALDQNVIGEAAAVFVLSIDRAAFAADASGPARGYRHAFVEAGRAGERLYLEAGARALAACAVGAFHDDEAAALIGADPAREWVVHFAALGWPAG
jgi:SagB-type dehydrogenase family enzyme